MATVQVWFKRKYSEASVSDLFYILSMATYVFGVFLARWFGRVSMDYASVIGMLGVGAGFMAWCLPIAIRWTKSAWDTHVGKVCVALVHLLVLLIATSMSRRLVSDALGLPPQTFDLTVGFLVVIFYIPALMAVASIMMFLASWGLMIVGGAYMCVRTILSFLKPMLEVVGVKREIPKPSFSTALHSVGAVLVAVGLMGSSSFMSNLHQPWIYSTVRVLAVLSDFTPAVDYPGVQPGERVHPLENGLIAFANPGADKTIAISIRKQEDGIQPYLVGQPIPSVKEMVSPLVDAFR